MKKIVFMLMIIIGSIGFAREDRGQGANDFEKFQYKENYKNDNLAEENAERFARMRKVPAEERIPTYTSEDFAMREFGGGGSGADRR